jgi:hypothetical protein
VTLTETRRFLAAIGLAFLMAACANQLPFMHPQQHYSGPPRSASETATVFSVAYASAGYGGLHGYIYAVDGRRTTLTTGAPLEVYVLPGVRNVEMVAGDGKAGRADGDVSFTAEAGHTYEIIAELVSPDLVHWSVVDRGTGFRRTDEVYREAVRRGFVKTTQD